jgi:hypothetical protein
MNRTAHIRPVIGAVAVAALAVSGVAAQAAPAKKAKPVVRKVTISYTGACGVDATTPAETGGAGLPVCPVGATYTITRKSSKEKYLTVLITDSAGKTVPANLWLNNSKAQPFCGSLKNYPIAQASYALDLNEGVDTTCPGETTTGKLTIIYSSLKQK